MYVERKCGLNKVSASETKVVHVCLLDETCGIRHNKGVKVTQYDVILVQTRSP